MSQEFDMDSQQLSLEGFNLSISKGNTLTLPFANFYLASNPNGYLSSVSFSQILSKPTTIAGYGITDALSTTSASSTYFPIPTGTITQYLRGNGSLATFPTALSFFSNDVSYITSAALTAYLTSASAASTYAPINNPTFTGTVGGITKSMIGLSLVDNTSDAEKPISTATQTALNNKENSLGNPSVSGYILSSSTSGVRTWVAASSSSGTSWGLIAGTLSSQTDLQTALDLKLNTSSAASTYLPINNPTATGTLTSPTIANTLGANFATTSGNVGIGTASPVSRLDIQGTTATDTAPLGSELLTSSNWTSTGWTGSFATGWVHTTGNTTVLSNTLVASNATYYQIAYTVTGRTAGTFDISFGGVNTTGLSSTGAVGILSTSTGTLSITPTSTFDGTIIISIKTIGTSTALITYKNSSGTVVNEVRNTTSNIFYGINSGQRITTGTNNIIYGSNAGVSITTGGSNVLIGNESGNIITTGNSNTAVGHRSGWKTTTGSNNSFFGNSAGQYNTTGVFNTFIGATAGQFNTTGNSNVALGGDYVFVSNTTGSNNTAIGGGSLNQNTTGEQNTAIGRVSLSSNTTGSNNTALGNNAGRWISGSLSNAITNNSIFIGAETKALANNQTNQIVIGYGTVGNGSNTTVLGNTNTTQTQIFGNTILSNTAQATDTGEKLQVNGTSKFVGNSAFTGNSITLNGNTTEVSQSIANNATGTVYCNYKATDGNGISAFFGTSAGAEIAFGGSSNHPISFFINNARIARFNTNGNLGIGTALPTEKLNVSGNILATGTILGSNLSGTNTGDNATNTQYSGLAGSKQDTLSGTGFVKSTAGIISYDTSTYLTTSSASSTYAPLASPTFTGTVSGITKSMVGLGSVDNTSDTAKPISTATQTALNLKENSLGNPAADGYILSSTSTGTRSWIVAPSGGGGGTWGSITGTLSSQTDLQNALNLKENLTNKSTDVNLGVSDTLYPTQNAVKTYVDSIVPTSTSIVRHIVKAGESLTKGQAVYVSGANGTNMVVTKASNTSEATSSKTMGLIAQTLANNGQGDVIAEGLLSGLNTNTATIGDPVWLGTNGNLIYGLTNKPYAPAHLVFIGIVTRVSATVGEIFVKVQNGFELNEIHDVDLKTTAPVNGDILGYNGTLWVNKTITALGGQTQLNGTGFVKASGTTITYDNSTYLTSTTAASTYLPIANPTSTGTLTAPTITNSLGANFATSSGNVGIGTSSPASKLTISGGSLATSGNGLHFASELTTGRTGTYDASSVSSIHTFFDTKTVELAAGSTNGYVTGISATGVGGTLFSGTLRFLTSSAERMRILANGNVGIGTTAPNSVFHTVGTIQTSSISSASSNYANRFNNIIFSRSDVPTTYTNVISNSFSGTTTDQTMSFEIGNGASTRVVAMTLIGNGNVCVGTSTDAGYKLNVNGTAKFTDVTCTSITETSSERYKENIHTLDNSLSKVTSLRGVQYNRKGNTDKEIGVIAEEVANVLPEVIKYNNEGEPDSVSYARLSAVFIEAFKEQQQQIELLKQEINLLKQQ